MDKKRILVTGGSGFIGRHLVHLLLAEGNHLVLAVRSPDNLPAAWRSHNQIRLVETGPLETATNLGEALRDVCRVVHIAGLAHASDKAGAAPFEQANVAVTGRLVEAAASTGSVTAFIHMSSIATVTDRSSDGMISDGEGQPDTHYGASKRSAEIRVLSMADRGTFAISLRPPLVIGADARGSWRALQKLAATGLPLPFGSVRNRRSLLDVNELARAISHLCSRDWPAGLSGNYCIAHPEAISLTEIVRELRLGMNLSPRLVPIPPSALYGIARIAGATRLANQLFGNLEVDASRFRDVFGFEQTQDVRASVRESGRAFVRDRSRA